MKKYLRKIVSVLCAVCLFTASMSVSAFAGDREMYRLYNPYTGEHFYTASSAEREMLCVNGWRYEGVGWVAPEKSSVPVYRLYNPNAGDHHYTVNAAERDMLVKAGWNDEQIGWYSDASERVPLYRAYNRNAVAGAHNYTTGEAEQMSLIQAGWADEGIAWYGVGAGSLYSPRTFRVAVNTDADDYTTSVAQISRQSAAYVHYSLTGGDTEHKESYICKASLPDGDLVDNKAADSAGGAFTQKLYWPKPDRAPSGTVQVWLEDCTGRKVAEASFYWG